MSHVAKVAIEVTDLNALKAAVARLGCEFLEGQKTYRWYGWWMNDYSADQAAYHHGVSPKDYGKCEHAIKVPGAEYDVGVVKNPNGNGYVLIYDNFCQGLGIEKVVGANCGKLVQQYGAEKAKATMRTKGFVASEKWINGKLQVTFAKQGA